MPPRFAADDRSKPRSGVRRSRLECGPRAIVEVQIPADRGAGLADAVVGVQIDLLVLDRSPDPLDEDVVAPGALAVHADRDLVLRSAAGEGLAGELAALIGVEDLRLSVLASASSSASMQKAASIVIDSRQASTRRLNQSTTAAR